MVHPANETERLASLRAHAILDTEADPYLDNLVRRSAARLKMPIALVNIVDGDRQWAKAAFGLPNGYELPRETAFCSHAILSPDTLTIIPDARLDPRVADNPLVTGKPGFRFYAGAPITDGAGHALGAICVIDTKPREFSAADADVLSDIAQDVSSRLELYRSNAALQESEDHYRTSVDLNPHMPWTASAQGESEEATGRYLSLVGVDAASASSYRSWMRTVHPDDLAAAQAAWSECLRSGRHLDLEYRLRLADGKYRWCRVRAAPRCDAAGHIMRWYGTVEDIQDRKGVTASLHETEALLRQALDVARLRTWELDLATRRLTASDVSVINFGLHLGAEISSYDDALARIHPDDQVRCGLEMEKAWSSGQEVEIEYRSIWPDGSIHWVRITGSPTRDDAGKPMRLVGLSLDITEQRQAEEERQRAEARVVYLAHHDVLTGLANRRMFHQILVTAIAAATDHEKVAVFLVDLDDFKVINDTMGYDAGDQLLQHTAETLKSCLPGVQAVARYGSDEFVVLLTGVAASSEMEALAGCLLTALHIPVVLGDQSVVLGASIGISVAPDDTNDAYQLLRNADTALQRTKARDVGSYHYFKPDMDSNLQTRAKIRLDLRDALSRGEFRLFYQPLVNMKTGRIVSFEALLRWQHPLRGIVSPADFIPLTEETGWIVSIGKWVMEEACRQAATWPGGVGVAVNLSPVQFGNKMLEAEISAALANSGLPASRLELEVTETLLLQDSESNTRTLRALRQSGVRIAMDDFGTGYSSLGYLRRFPFDKIKIDQSLIRDIPDGAGGDAVVQAIIGLAHSLGISTTAEGVETQAQFDLLQEHGCTQVQGYLLGRPMPASETSLLLERGFAPGHV